MNIKINKEQLFPALLACSSVVEKKQTLPILSNLLLRQSNGVLTIIGSNLEVEVKRTLYGMIDDEVEVTLAANKLVDICRALPAGSNINFKIDESKVILTTGKSRFTLKSLPAEEFPELNIIDYQERFTLPVTAFKKILDMTAFSMAAQDVRFYLNGLLLEVDNNRLIAVATDGHRLSKSEVIVDNDQTPDKHQIIIPRKTVNEIMRLLSNLTEDDVNEVESVKLEFNVNHVKLTAGSTVITSTLIIGHFPEYQSILAADLDKSIQIDRQQFLDTLSRIAVLTNERRHDVRLHFTLSNTIEVSTNNPEHEAAEDELPCVYDGQEVTTSFNVTYIIEALKVINSEQVILHIKDKDSVCLLEEPDDPLTSWLVMPMRL